MDWSAVTQQPFGQHGRQNFRQETQDAPGWLLSWSDQMHGSSIDANMPSEIHCHMAHPVDSHSRALSAGEA
jgi:hypothetical protein